MHSHTHEDTVRPTCPFCSARWTDAMLDRFDAVTGASSCVCCTSTIEPTEPAEPPPIPAEDLCCDVCGRAIYLKPEIAGV